MFDRMKKLIKMYVSCRDKVTAPASSCARETLDAEMVKMEKKFTRAHLNIKDNIYRGRNVAAGYARGLSLEFGNLVNHLHNDASYVECMELASGVSIVTEAKLMNLFLIIKYGLNNLEGDVIEFGSYRGGSALFMAKALKKFHPQKKIYALDTFSGMPPTNKRIDMHTEGDFSGPILDEFYVKKERNGLDNLVIVKGKFEDTMPQLKEKVKCLALAHIDCDIYSSVVYSVEQSLSLMENASGYLCFDDPLHSSCLGAYEAVEDTVERLNLKAEQTYPHLVYRYPPINV